MEELGLMSDYHSENVEELKQKLLHATLEIESTNKINQELFHLLSITFQERDELREQLTIGLNKLTHRANSSITESNTLSHGSSSEFSHASVVESGNLGYFNRHYLVSSEKLEFDRANVVFGSLVKGKALPAKGKLLQAVMEAGTLLEDLLVTGPLPCWRNPPPLQVIQAPPFTIRDFKSN